MVLSTQSRNRIEYQLKYLVENQDRLVVDADVHATDIADLHAELKRQLESTDDYFHGRPVSAEDLILEMNMAGVDMALIWQNPTATVYCDDPERNFERLLAANRYIHHASVKYPNRFIPAGWTDPKALGLDRAIQLVGVCVREFGFAIVKMNPAQNAFPIDGEQVISVFEAIVQQGAIPAFHFGSDTDFTPAEGLENLAKRHPDCPVIAVHMGGGGASYAEAEILYKESRKLGLRHPNIRFVLSAKRDTHVESDLITYQLAGEPFCHNLYCASDAPYGRMAWNFGGYRGMLKSLMDGEHHTDERVRRNPCLFTEDTIKNFLGRNFVKLTIERYRDLLK